MIKSHPTFKATRGLFTAIDSKYLDEITHKINRPKVTFGIENE